MAGQAGIAAEMKPMLKRPMDFAETVRFKPASPSGPYQLTTSPHRHRVKPERGIGSVSALIFPLLIRSALFRGSLASIN
jgi:hypothetical protein